MYMRLCCCFKRGDEKSGDAKTSQVLSNEKHNFETKLLVIENKNLKIIPSFDRKLLDIISTNGELLSLNMWIIESGKIVLSKDEISLGADKLNEPLFDIVIERINEGVDTAFLMIYNEVLYFANTKCFYQQQIKGGVFFVRQFGSPDKFKSGIATLKHTLTEAVKANVEKEIRKSVHDNNDVVQSLLLKMESIIQKQVDIDTLYMESRYGLLQKYIEGEVLTELDKQLKEDGYISNLRMSIQHSRTNRLHGIEFSNQHLDDFNVLEPQSRLSIDGLVQKYR